MARIRSIKPEFPQSESMGRVSREARLCFVLLWTIADDEGRLRGNSRMLASLLYPYDGDAPKAIDRWLTELATENCIVRYQVEGNQYIEIPKWLAHQRIDKPSKSKIPAFANVREDSQSVREASCTDGNGVEGIGVEGNGKEGTGRLLEMTAAVLEFMEAWSKAPGAVHARKMDGKRLAALRARLAESDWDWKAALAKFPLKCFAASPEGWKPDLDWFVRPETVSKILEGKYDWSKSNGNKPANTPGPGQRYDGT